MFSIISFILKYRVRVVGNVATHDELYLRSGVKVVTDGNFDLKGSGSVSLWFWCLG